MSRITLITTEPLPLPGWPATGAGLRAWGLAQGLRSRGHEVRLLMPEGAAAGFAPEPGKKPPTRDLPDWIGTFHRAKLKEDPRVNEGDVLVLQHWGIARELGEIHIPLAIDLAGPHLLERRFWGSASPEKDLLEKLAALRGADFLTCSGALQRLYFLPYLAMAGWKIATLDDPLPVIPYSLRPDAAPAPARGDRFIYGGYFLPWQNPAAIIEIVLEELERAGRGELCFIGGAHPTLDVSRGKFEPLLQRIKQHPRARMFEPMAYDDYVALLREGGIALDLMERNAERELAFTSRTVQFLACGLPVIHNNYSELGGMIREAGAGWTFDPADREGMRRLLRSMLDGSADPSLPARAALELAREKLDWERTIDPLDRFCREPQIRDGKVGDQLAFEGTARRLEKAEFELSTDRRELNMLKGKRWIRWGLSVFSARGWLRWPMALLAAIIGIGLLPLFWINDHIIGKPQR